MNGKRLVKVKVSPELVFVEMVLEEIKPLQGIRLFDIGGSQDAVPTPLLIDGALAAVQVLHRNQFFVQETILLQVNLMLL